MDESQDIPASGSSPESSRRSSVVPVLPQLKISVFYTRAPTHQDEQALRKFRPSEDPTGGQNQHLSAYKDVPLGDDRPVLPPGITIHSGRPHLPKILDEFLDCTLSCTSKGKDPEKASISRGEASGVVVGVCGPLCLAEDVRKATGGVDEGKRSNVGGIEMVEE